MVERAAAIQNVVFGGVVLLFYVFVFFPYVKVLPIGSDTQPGAFLLGLFILGLSSRSLKLPVHCWALGLVALAALAVFLMDLGSVAAARSLFGYISLFVVTAATYLCARAGRPLKYEYLLVFVIVWFVLGIAQFTIDRELGTGILSAARTMKGRGVVSFAVEPSFYGSMMLFVLLVLMAEKREFSLAGLLCIVQIFFLAQTSVVVFALAIPAAAYLLLKLHIAVRKPYFWAAVFVFALLVPYAIGYLETTRIGSLVELVIENPALLVIADGSGNSRAAAIYLSIAGAFENFLIPRGFDAYLDYAGSVAWEFRNLFWHLELSDRIMSGYGAVLFELGIFGLIVPVVITMAIFRHFGRAEWPKSVVLSAATHAIMFTAVPMALPALGFLIGHLLANPAPRISENLGQQKVPPGAALAAS